MGKRDRRRRPSERAFAPERSLLVAIADGQLDDHLTALAEAVRARQHLLHTVRSATALATLCAGDRVRITEAVSPRYLAGMHGTVIDVDDQAATIRLPRPVGRFHSGHVRCPPLALQKLVGSDRIGQLHGGARSAQRVGGRAAKPRAIQLR